MFYTYLVFLWQLSVIHPFLHFPIYNSFPIGCHFIFSHVPFSVIHHSVSSSISCHHLLSVISYCLSFLIIYHPYRLYITQHCRSVYIAGQSQLSVIPPWSIIPTFCHSPIVYYPFFSVIPPLSVITHCPPLGLYVFPYCLSYPLSFLIVCHLPLSLSLPCL